MMSVFVPYRDSRAAHNLTLAEIRKSSETTLRTHTHCGPLRSSNLRSVSRHQHVGSSPTNLRGTPSSGAHVRRLYMTRLCTMHRHRCHRCRWRMQSSCSGPPLIDLHVEIRGCAVPSRAGGAETIPSSVLHEFRASRTAQVVGFTCTT